MCVLLFYTSVRVSCYAIHTVIILFTIRENMLALSSTSIFPNELAEQ